MDYEGEGFYAGVWTSTTGDYGAGSVDETGQEVDLYIGTEVNGFDIGFIKYEYALNGDFSEYYVGYSYEGFDLFYAQNTETSSKDYFSVSYGLPTVVEGLDASVTYGDDGSKDFIQLDLSVGDVVLSLVDTDNGTLSALSYSLPL